MDQNYKLDYFYWLNFKRIPVSDSLLNFATQKSTDMGTYEHTVGLTRSTDMGTYEHTNTKLLPTKQCHPVLGDRDWWIEPVRRFTFVFGNRDK